MDLKGTIYWSIYRDVFALMKDLMPAQTTDQYWDTATEKAEALCRKYENTEEESFARAQIMSVLNELDRLGKETKAKCGIETRGQKR